MLLLLEEQAGEACKPRKSNAHSDIREFCHSFIL